MSSSAGIFGPYLAMWDLEVDGAPIVTRAARLLPVRSAGEPAMLKVALEAEERHGAALIAAWAGRGAARVLAADGDAMVMERATGGLSLAAHAREGRDDEATRVICDVVATLHAAGSIALPHLVPLTRWFHQLAPAAHAHGGRFARAWSVARDLLNAPQDIGVLHGDVHHGNILDFGARGWRAIDPKGLLGERGFDYANLFCNPDFADPACEVAVRPDVFAARLDIVASHANLDRRRLLEWIVAWTGLSAAWSLADQRDTSIAFRIADMAAHALE